MQAVARTMVSPQETQTLPSACLASSPVEKTKGLFPRLEIDNETDMPINAKLLCDLSVALRVFFLEIAEQATTPADKD